MEGRALTMKQAIELSEAWKALEKQTIFLVTHGKEFLVEHPGERQDRDSDLDEAVLRVFTEAEDAWLYAEEQQENYAEDEETIHVKGVSLVELFNYRKAIDNNSGVDFGVTVRVDVCTLRAGEPVVIDTLWSSAVDPN